MPGDQKDKMRLSVLFEIAVDLPANHPSREAQQQHFYNLEMAAVSPFSDELGLPGGLMSRIAWTPAKLEKLEKLRKKDDFLSFILQLIIDDILQRINKLMQYHWEQMERLLEEMAQEQATLDSLREDNIAIERVLTRYRADGTLVIDAPALAAISAYEQRNGVRLENHEYASLLDVDVDIDNLRRQIQITLIGQQAEYEYHKEKRKELGKLRDDVKFGMNPADFEAAIEDVEQFEQDRDFSLELLDLQLAAQIEEHPNLSNARSLSTLVEGDNDLDTDEFSFDFPPLEKSFAQASKGPPTSIKPMAETQVATSKPIIPKI